MKAVFLVAVEYNDVLAILCYEGWNKKGFSQEHGGCQLRVVEVLRE